MVILKQKLVLSVIDQHVSQLKLNIFKYQLNQLAFIYCMLYLQCEYLKIKKKTKLYPALWFE